MAASSALLYKVHIYELLAELQSAVDKLTQRSETILNV